MAVTMTVRVSNRPPGDSEPARWEEDHVASAIYQITDKHPKLYIGLSNDIKVDEVNQSGGTLKKEGRPLAGLQWYSWLPLTDSPSNSRRFGLFEMMLKSLGGLSFACYLWPERLFNKQQFLRILHDIEMELQQPVLWDTLSHSARSWVEHSESLSNPVGPQLLDAVEAIEMPVARALTAQPDGRGPWIEGGPPSLLRVTTPERRLLTAWATRRARQLGSWRDELKRYCSDAKRLLTDRTGNPEAQRRIQAQLDEKLNWLDRASRAGNALDGLRLRYGLTEGTKTLDLTPSMQRDYRLRRLLKAFSPLPSERWVDHAAMRSRRPPARATDLFEIWVAVHIVGALRQLGWQGPAPEIRGASPGAQNAPLACRWRLTRGAWTLLFEHGPDVLTRGPAPPVEHRVVTGHTWALDRVADDQLFSLTQLEPDYALRLYGPDGQALAIGDASLADPQHQKGDKVETIARYREQIAWKTPSGRLCRVHHLGLFLTLPGPSTDWATSKLLQRAADLDCRVLYATADAPYDEVMDLVRNLVETLSRSVSQ